MGPDPLGIFSAAVLQPKDLNLASGDRFFLYTDGLIEATLLFLSTLRAANARIPVLVALSENPTKRPFHAAFGTV
jgi:hypothetical protein